MANVSLNHLTLYNVSEINITRDRDGEAIYLKLTYRDPKRKYGGWVDSTSIHCFSPDDEPVSVYISGNGIEIEPEPAHEVEDETESEVVGTQE